MERYYKHKPANIVLFEYVKEKNNLLQRHFTCARKGDKWGLWTSDILDDLLHFFSSNLLEKRYFYGDKLVDWFFGTHDTEEFNEFRRRLTKLEIEGRLFSNYRDHTNHTFLVFILGAYLYEKLSKFREYYRVQCGRDRRLDPSIPEEKDFDKVDDNFLFRWLYVSLLHDIGYTFSYVDEENSESRSSLLPMVFRKMEPFFNHYIRYWFPSEERSKFEDDVVDLHALLGMHMEFPEIKDKGKISEEELQQIIEWLVFCPYFKELSSDIESTNSFEILQAYSKSFSPLHSKLLKEYFTLLATKGSGVGYEKRIFDHGILSALVYMKLVSFGLLLTMKIEDIKLDRNLTLRQQKMIRTIKENVGGFIYHRGSVYGFIGIAWAIAIHNLRPMKGDERIASFNKTIFPIRPKDNFLACLLYLVDVLQDWDRDKLRLEDYTSPETASLQSYEISIEVKEEKIRISYLESYVTKERINKMKSDLRNLDEEVQSMIDFKPIPADAFFETEKL